jgi:hypothetical protein
MAIMVDIENVRVAQCVNPIPQHIFVVTQHQRKRQTLHPVLAAHNLVMAILGKKIEPNLQSVLIQQAPIFLNQGVGV